MAITHWGHGFGFPTFPVRSQQPSETPALSLRNHTQTWEDPRLTAVIPRADTGPPNSPHWANSEHQWEQSCGTRGSRAVTLQSRETAGYLPAETPLKSWIRQCEHKGTFKQLSSCKIICIPLSSYQHINQIHYFHNEEMNICVASQNFKWQYLRQVFSP